jgi:hypothetical protein
MDENQMGRLKNWQQGKDKSIDFIEFYQVNEILRRFFLPYISQQNGVLEKRNKCLCNVEVVLNMLLSIVLMGGFWGLDALLMTTYLQNKQHSKTIPNLSPYEI